MPQRKCFRNKSSKFLSPQTLWIQKFKRFVCTQNPILCCAPRPVVASQLYFLRFNTVVVFVPYRFFLLYQKTCIVVCCFVCPVLHCIEVIFSSRSAVWPLDLFFWFYKNTFTFDVQLNNFTELASSRASASFVYKNLWKIKVLRRRLYCVSKPVYLYVWSDLCQEICLEKYERRNRGNVRKGTVTPRVTWRYVLHNAKILINRV